MLAIVACCLFVSFAFACNLFGWWSFYYLFLFLFVVSNNEDFTAMSTNMQKQSTPKSLKRSFELDIDDGDVSIPEEVKIGPKDMEDLFNNISSFSNVGANLEGINKMPLKVCILF